MCCDVRPHLRDTHVTAGQALVDVWGHQDRHTANLVGYGNKTEENLFADLFLHHGGVDLAHVAVLVTNTNIPGQKLVSLCYSA